MRTSLRPRSATLLGLAALILCAPCPGLPAGARSVLELQTFRTSESIAADDSTARRGRATLFNLNPGINGWFLLTLEWSDGRTSTWHLENPAPRTQRLGLSASSPRGLVLTAGGRTEACDLWGEAPITALDRARGGGAYGLLCGGRIYLRNPVQGHTTALERMTDLLRDHLPGGDRLVGFVNREIYRDRFRVAERASASGVASEPALLNAPLPPAIDPAQAGRKVEPEHLAIELDRPAGPVELGRWFPARGIDGVFVSVFEAGAATPALLASFPQRVHQLEPVEAGALVYLVAFDLDAFELDFMAGTDHPRVGWSDRAPRDVRTPGAPGPDGFDTLEPLVRGGLVSPARIARTVAAFTGGFKRVHAAFRSGPLSRVNQGSHYGFVEQGVVLSRLVPGLSTLYALDDGALAMKTWTEADDASLDRVRAARQNGVPLIEAMGGDGVPVPGALVADWRAGNWSGSADTAELRTLRAGACIQEARGHRFLLYGWFSDATPSGMARVFQAYGCGYAMHLDMNALEHTYLALYEQRDGALLVEHLAEGMAEVDKKAPGRSKALVPRFLGFSDDRDFFYVMRKERP